MAASGRIEAVVEGVLRGWAWDPDRAGVRLDVAVLVDNEPAGLARAERNRGDLQRHGIGDGRHGFELPLPLSVQDGAEHEVVLRADPEGTELARARLLVPYRTHMIQGKVERVAGTELFGWVWDQARPDATVEVELLADDQLLGTLPADRMRRDLLRAGIGNGAHGFVFDLARHAPPAGALLVVRALVAAGAWQVGAIEVPAGLAGPAPAPAAPSKPETGALAAARLAERQRDYPAAIRQAELGLVATPRDLDLLVFRARLGLAQNDFESAERFARAALEVQPGHAQASVLAARACLGHGEHAESVLLWAAVPPGHAHYRERVLKRGRSLMALGRAVEALAEFAAGAAADPADPETRRAAAEAAEAVGAHRTALRHWRRLAALLPADGTLAERMRELGRQVEDAADGAAFLVAPMLRNWTDAVEGEAGEVPVEPVAGLTLRAFGQPGARLRYAAAAPWQRRPGELPGYGLWLRAEGGAELAFALAPEAAAPLGSGWRMGLELQSLAGEAGAELLLDGGAAPRPLLRPTLEARPRLTLFDLTLDAAERQACLAGFARLVLRIRGDATLLLRPPREVAPLPPAAPPRGSFEAPQLAAALAALPSAAQPAEAPQ